MADALVWKFTQLGGPRKTLQLTGWSAPFGRARRAPIVNGGLHVGTQSTTYSDGSRTVHAFGAEGKPFELTGRWMDAGMAIHGGAQKAARDWKDFVGDRQEVRVSWGDILSYRIFIEDLDAHYESEDSVAWELKAIVLVDEAGQITTQPLPTTSPAQYAARLAALLNATRAPFHVSTSTSLAGILTEVSDAFDVLVSSMNGPFAAVYDTASALSSFESALSADLQKMGAGVQSLRTSVLEMRDLNELLISRTALMSGELGTAVGDVQGGLFSGPDILQLTAAKADADLATANMLALIAEMQNDIDRRLRGDSGTAHAAQSGDTWEKIGTRSLGSPDAGRAIRAMNGIRYGAKPQPGRRYTIPRGT
jgi:hypothetical protein